MCIPKTNRSFEEPAKLSGQSRTPVVAFFPRLAANLLTLIAGSLLLASLTVPLQSHAVPLNASALAGTDSVSFMTARNNTALLSEDDAKLHADTDFLEADIADFAPRHGPPHSGKDKTTRFAETGSFGTANTAPSGAPFHATEERENSPRGGGTATAGMPVMAIVWLFGIGLIGIGTVGRRKQSKP
ncbi:MAG: hypothetical protein J5I92_06410 [Thiogranum sp.]|nr:hypothetical protein [Thiogranum sp.]